MMSCGSMSFRSSDHPRPSRSAYKRRAMYALGLLVIGLGWADVGQAAPLAPKPEVEVATSTDASAPITWSLSLLIPSPRVEPMARRVDREAWVALYASLPASIKAEVDGVVARLAGASGASPSSDSNRRAPSLDALVSELGELERRHRHPVFRLMALRLLAQAHVEASRPQADLRAVYDAMVASSLSLRDACDEASDLTTNPHAPVVVGYVDACAATLKAGMTSPGAVDALLETSRRIPVERWAASFWEVARAVAVEASHDGLLVGTSAALSVIEERACEAGCDDRVPPAQMLAMQRALYTCAGHALQTGPHPLSDADDPFAECVRTEVPQEHHADVVWIQSLPLE